MKNIQFLTRFLFVFLVLAIARPVYPGILDAARNLVTDTVDFAGDVVKDTGEFAGDVVGRTAEIFEPSRSEIEQAQIADGNDDELIEIDEEEIEPVVKPSTPIVQVDTVTEAKK